METKVRTQHPINLLHGASGQTIPLDPTKVLDLHGTIEEALRQALDKHVHRSVLETLDSGEGVDVELYCEAGEGGQPVERPLSLTDDWQEIVTAAEEAAVELGVARHARGGGHVGRSGLHWNRDSSLALSATGVR